MSEAEMSIAAEKLPLPCRDIRQKKLPRRCRDAMVYKKKLPRRCRDATAYKKILPHRFRDAMAHKLVAAALLPRWFSKKCFKFHCCDCIGPEILVLDHQIHSVSGCFTCKH
jgi:hypothetical protein